MLFVAGRRAYRIASGPQSRGDEVLALILASARLLEHGADVPVSPRPPGGPAVAAQPAELPVGAAPVVRVAYLVPTDRILDLRMRHGLDRSIRDVQAHFHGEL